MSLNEIVQSDCFAFVVGLAAVISAVSAVIAVCRINTLIDKQDSNTIRTQNQIIRGTKNRQAGRDNH